ncbi:MAG: 4Fe-4S dicluster domain-containing protein [Lachnospirales bacterium]
MHRVKINREKCIGCLTCVTACIVSHKSCDSRSRVVVDSRNKNCPIFCNHCERPECVYTCMSGAMKKEEDGLVSYDKEQCAQCYMCVMACPYGVLKPDFLTKQEIMKCNLCEHRTEDGSPNPMCVEKCPMGAIENAEV